jgi:hypothetical protein
LSRTKTMAAQLSAYPNPGYPNPGITEGIENGPASGLTDDTFKVRP